MTTPKPDCTVQNASHAKCEHCGAPFKPKKGKKFCSKKCKKAKWDRSHITVFWSEDKRQKLILITR